MLCRIHVHYPPDRGQVGLRTELDWDHDAEPTAVSADGSRLEYRLEAGEHRHFLRCKPVLHADGGLVWGPGDDAFVPVGSPFVFEGYPYFFQTRGRVTDLIRIGSELGDPRDLRVYLPPGYDENELARFPVVYMQDGANLFLPEEAFAGQEWQVDETLHLLESMRLMRRAIVVGIHSRERVAEYTKPGYTGYGLSLKDEVKPAVDTALRTLAGPSDTSVMGSSLGGVVAFYLGWQWPEVFGQVACLSSTFGFRDDLIERVQHEPVDGARKDLKIYLDSGWPRDNYEETFQLALALAERGFVYGRDVLHSAFPLERHTEAAWRERLHLPLQFLNGHVRRLSAALRHSSPLAAGSPTYS